MKNIYLDYAATTPVDPRVQEKMLHCLSADGAFGNASADLYIQGVAARDAVEHARSQVAAAINAAPREIIWTSGATESDNLAIKGIAEFYQRRGKHIITTQTEHKAVLDSCHALEKQGFNITYLKPQKNGAIDVEDLKNALTVGTILVSLMLVNNETGYIQDIANLGKVVKQHGSFFHVDAAQAIGKIAVDVQVLHADLMSLSAHKVYGPKGVGALYLRHKPPVKITAQMHGGGQEQGLRSGTLATHQVVAMGAAFNIATLELKKDQQHTKQLQQQLITGLKTIEGVQFNTDFDHSVSNIVNVSFAHVDGDALLKAVTQKMAVSNGSACNSVSIEPSYVLQAMGLSANLARSSVRFSFGRFTTADEIAEAVNIVKEVLHEENSNA